MAVLNHSWQDTIWACDTSFSLCRSCRCWKQVDRFKRFFWGKNQRLYVRFFFFFLPCWRNLENYYITADSFRWASFYYVFQFNRGSDTIIDSQLLLSDCVFFMHSSFFQSVEVVRNERKNENLRFFKSLRKKIKNMSLFLLCWGYFYTQVFWILFSPLNLSFWKYFSSLCIANINF